MAAQLVGHHQILPPRRVIRHVDAVIVAQADAGMLEYAADGGIKLARDLRLCAPNGTQYRGNIHRSDFVDGPVEDGFAEGGAKMSFPLVLSLSVRCLLVAISDDELRDLSE